MTRYPEFATVYQIAMADVTNNDSVKMAEGERSAEELKEKANKYFKGRLQSNRTSL